MNAEAKGELFQETISYIKEKYGQRGSSSLGVDEREFIPVKWYPFSEYCSLLFDIYRELMDGDMDKIYRMGYEMITKDERWRSVFEKREPREVLSSTKRQEEQYRLGDIQLIEDDEDEIILEFMMNLQEDLCMELWSESYRGRLAGVLELTGHDGSVELDMDLERRVSVYTVEWD